MSLILPFNAQGGHSPHGADLRRPPFLHCRRMNTLRSLAEGNRLQRAYYRWAEPYYERMEPHLREQTILIDRFLYSRRGLGFWLGLLAAVVGSSVGLHKAGMPWWLAIGLSVLAWLGLPLILLSAWLQPARFGSPQVRKAFPRILLMAALGALFGFAVGHVARHGRLDPELLLERLWSGMKVLGPAVLLVSVAMVALMWGVSQVRRQMLERELAQLQLERERDAAARDAVQAQLKLLQGQIQPHFIFNTLSAVQHWVDQGDPRGAPLLRALTAFLRGSTEALARDDIRLADEVALVGHYLTIMQARLGERLQVRIDIDPHAAEQTLPPGLLLTQVENAVEHGIAQRLSGGEIRLEAHCDADSLTIDISDTAAQLPDTVVEGVGLRNSRERLRHRFAGQASLDLFLHEGRSVARIRLPLARPRSV